MERPDIARHGSGRPSANPLERSSPKNFWPEPDTAAAQLGEADVHLWAACLDDFSPLVRSFESVLLPDEHTLASRFQAQRHRDRFVIQRGLLRCLLSRYRQVAPVEHRFTHSSHGKPEVVPLPAETPLFFNVSHSDSLVLFAVARATPVGVDIEKVRPINDLEAVADRFFASAEATALKALSDEQRFEGFFNCWTRKEAILKATGEGITGGLDIIEVTLKPGEPARVLKIQGDTETAKHWCLHPLRPIEGSIAALAYHGPPLRLGYWAVPLTILK